MQSTCWYSQLGMDAECFLIPCFLWVCEQLHPVMNKEKRRGREINQETKGARLLMISCFSQKVENVIGREVCVCFDFLFVIFTYSLGSSKFKSDSQTTKEQQQKKSWLTLKGPWLWWLLFSGSSWHSRCHSPSPSPEWLFQKCLCPEASDSQSHSLSGQRNRGMMWRDWFSIIQWTYIIFSSKQELYFDSDQPSPFVYSGWWRCPSPPRWRSQSGRWGCTRCPPPPVWPETQLPSGWPQPTRPYRRQQQVKIPAQNFMFLSKNSLTLP